MNGATIRIRPEPPRQPEILALLAESDAFSEALYPPESNHLIDVDTLARPNVRFLVARDAADAALGCGAVVLEGEHGELKRMYLRAAARGLGVGRLLLGALEAQATAAGVGLLRLETGIHNHEALRLYRAAGYREIGPFGGYGPDPVSVFMEKRLNAS